MIDDATGCSGGGIVEIKESGFLGAGNQPSDRPSKTKTVTRANQETHASKTKTQMAKTRILTDIEIELVQERIRDGESMRNAAKWIEENLHKQISHSTLASYPEITKAVSQRQSASRIETKEVLDGEYPEVIKAVLKSMATNRKRAKALDDALETADRASKLYLSISKEIRQLDASYAEFSKEYRQYHAASELRESELHESFKETTEERIKRVDEYLAGRKKEEPKEQAN